MRKIEQTKINVSAVANILADSGLSDITSELKVDDTTENESLAIASESENQEKRPKKNDLRKNGINQI